MGFSSYVSLEPESAERGSEVREGEGSTVRGIAEAWKVRSTLHGCIVPWNLTLKDNGHYAYGIGD